MKSLRCRHVHVGITRVHTGPHDRRDSKFLPTLQAQQRHRASQVAAGRRTEFRRLGFNSPLFTPAGPVSCLTAGWLKAVSKLCAWKYRVARCLAKKISLELSWLLRSLQWIILLLARIWMFVSTRTSVTVLCCQEFWVVVLCECFQWLMALWTCVSKGEETWCVSMGRAGMNPL